MTGSTWRSGSGSAGSGRSPTTSSTATSRRCPEAKPAAAIVLLLPRFALLKEWAYAGAAFTWMMAVVAHYTAGDGAQVWSIAWCCWPF
ncbi:MAG: DoxX family protein [Vicinamibacterales bacterium]